MHLSAFNCPGLFIYGIITSRRYLIHFDQIKVSPPCCGAAGAGTNSKNGMRTRAALIYAPWWRVAVKGKSVESCEQISITLTASDDQTDDHFGSIAG